MYGSTQFPESGPNAGFPKVDPLVFNLLALSELLSWQLFGTFPLNEYLSLFLPLFYAIVGEAVK